MTHINKVIEESFIMFDKTFPVVDEAIHFDMCPCFSCSATPEKVKSIMGTSFSNLLDAVGADVEGIRKKEPDKCACNPKDKVPLCAWHAHFPIRNYTIDDIQAIIKSAKEQIR